MKPSVGVALAMIMLLLSGCAGNQSVLNAHGASAIHLKNLIIGIVAICSVVWMVVMIVLMWVLFRSPNRRLPSSLATQKWMGFVVVGAVGATAIIIAGLTTASFVTTRALGLADPVALTIKVRGQQWWWHVSYVDPNPARSFDTANEIHIPVGENLRIQLEAADVIHSFWVPSLSGKRDLIPGRLNEITIRAERAGVYRGQCAEFCGLQHSHMAMLVVAEEREAYERWTEAQRRQAPQQLHSEAAAGEAVFLSKPCAACHTVRGTTAAGSTGPDLTHVGSRRTIGAGLFETTRGSLAAWIADPQTLKPGNNMPMVELSSDELRQVSAYLAALK